MEYRLGKYRGKFAVVWWDAKLGSQRRSLGIDARPENREAAETAIEQWRADQRRDESRPGGIITVGRCLDGYFDSHPDVIRRSVLRKHFGAMLPDHIDDRACQEYTESRLKAGRSPSTINSELTIMRTALTWAVKQKWIDAAPAVERPTPAPPRDRWLAKEEAQKLLAAAGSPHIKLFVLLALHSTARAGAILGLTWDRVSFDLNRIDFNEAGRRRSRKRRAVVAMTPELHQALKRAKEEALTDFVIEYAGKQVGSVRTGFEKAARRAKLDEVTPHTLRHTAATWMAQRGVPMFEIAGMLGNSVRMVETVYAKHHPDFMTNATGALSDALDIGNAPLVQLNRSARTKNKPK